MLLTFLFKKRSDLYLRTQEVALVQLTRTHANETVIRDTAASNHVLPQTERSVSPGDVVIGEIPVSEALFRTASLVEPIERERKLQFVGQKNHFSCIRCQIYYCCWLMIMKFIGSSKTECSCASSMEHSGFTDALGNRLSPIRCMLNRYGFPSHCEQTLMHLDLLST